MNTPLVALLGRQEKPTDGVEDYCRYLTDALARRSVIMETTRFNWDEVGWISALRELRHRGSEWRGRWVVVHYTALAWSRRGFPVGILVALVILRRRGARCAVLFHEPARQGSPSRLRNKLRGSVQEWVIRECFRKAERAIFTVPLETIPWLPRNGSKAVYIPIGANIPAPALRPDGEGSSPETPKTVAVFCLDKMPALGEELKDIVRAVEVACKMGTSFRLVFLGRGTAEAKAEISFALRNVPIEVCNLGLLDAAGASDLLSRSDAMLFVRGRLNQCRGSALAAVACGLPLIGYAGEVESTPLAKAGVMLVPYKDSSALGAALARVLTDRRLAEELRAKSIRIRDAHYSWDIIAAPYVRIFESDP